MFLIELLLRKCIIGGYWLFIVFICCFIDIVCLFEEGLVGDLVINVNFVVVV